MNSINLDDYLSDLGITQDERPPTAHLAVPKDGSALTELTPQVAFKQFMQGLVRRLGSDYQVSVREIEPGVLEAEITGERANKLPGRDGQVLHAMETLAYAVLTRQFGPSDVKLRVDAGGYRQRQSETLASLAERLATQVAKSGEAHELQPMNASERRIIHLALKDNPLVTTESHGEGKGRHLIILPR